MLRFVSVFMWLCISTCSSAADDWIKAPKSGEGLFARKWCSGNLLCVNGQFKLGAIIYLLGDDSSRTCRASVTKSSVIAYETGDEISLAMLRLEACPNFTWQLAYSGRTNKRPSYRIINPNFAPDSQTAESIERQIRLRASDFETGEGEHSIKLSEQRPKILSLPSQAQDTYLVSFENDSAAKDPTHFLFAQGRIQLIHGAAKLSSLFSLNGNSYAHFKFGCWAGCGWGGDFVVRFSGTEFRYEMFDDAGST